MYSEIKGVLNTSMTNMAYMVEMFKCTPKTRGTKK